MKRNLSRTKRAKVLRKMRRSETPAEKRARRAKRNKVLNAWKRIFRESVVNIANQSKGTTNKNRLNFMNGVLKENSMSFKVEGKKYGR